LRLIIGLGSGRCGTTSLADLLSNQEDCRVTHEYSPVPWVFEKKAWDWATWRILSRLTPYDRKVTGEVGFYWLPYVERWLEIKSDTKFICLWRDRKEVMDSMWEFSRGLNVDPKDEWYRLYPYYPGVNNHEAIGLMWDDYDKISRMWKEKYPDKFMIIEMNKALNDEYHQRKMLEFAGFDNPRVRLGITLNTNEKPVGGDDLGRERTETICLAE